jgi:hypothetical protein
LIADALKYFSELAKKANGFHTTTTPDGQTHLLLPSGEVKSIPHPVLEVNDELTKLASLISWIKNSVDVDCEVFVSESSVDVVSCRADIFPPEGCRLQLHPSQPFCALSAFLRPGALVTQREIIRALRGKLAGTVEPALLTAFRSIEFRSDSSKNSEINRGGDSLGRQINRSARIGEGAELPEVIRFDMPIYEIVEAPKVTIEVAVEINYEAEKFEFLTVGETIARATETSLNSIASAISEATASRVYFGRYR